MKKASIILTIIVMALSVLTGCKAPAGKPTTSPNVPIVSETPAIPSPDITGSPGPDGTMEPVESMEPEESLKPVESLKPTTVP